MIKVFTSKHCIVINHQSDVDDIVELNFGYEREYLYTQDGKPHGVDSRTLKALNSVYETYPNDIEIKGRWQNYFGPNSSYYIIEIYLPDKKAYNWCMKSV